VIFTVGGVAPKPAFGTPHGTPGIDTIGLLGSPSSGSEGSRGGGGIAGAPDPAAGVIGPGGIITTLGVPAVPIVMGLVAGGGVVMPGFVVGLLAGFDGVVVLGVELPLIVPPVGAATDGFITLLVSAESSPLLHPANAHNSAHVLVAFHHASRPSIFHLAPPGPHTHMRSQSSR
jgi:hypothetical protein